MDDVVDVVHFSEVLAPDQPAETTGILTAAEFPLLPANGNAAETLEEVSPKMECASIPAIPAQRKRRKTLSRRAGQYGSIEKRNGMWRGRDLADIPEQAARVKRAVFLGSVREVTKSEARRKLVHIIQSQGLNAPHYRIPSTELFNERVASWRVSYLSRCKPSTQKQMDWQVQKYLLPR